MSDNPSPRRLLLLPGGHSPLNPQPVHIRSTPTAGLPITPDIAADLANRPVVTLDDLRRTYAAHGLPDKGRDR